LDIRGGRLFGGVRKLDGWLSESGWMWRLFFGDQEPEDDVKGDGGATGEKKKDKKQTDEVDINVGVVRKTGANTS